MPASMNNRHLADSGPVVVTASTLKEAYQRVRQEHGPDAVILGSRTITRRQEKGLGQVKLVEVTVQGPGAPAQSASSRPMASSAVYGAGQVQTSNTTTAAKAKICHDIVKEVNRIEELVATISQDHKRHAEACLPACDNPIADALQENGASRAIVSAVLTRFQSETGKSTDDQAAVRTWLIEQLSASNCAWSDFSGCHAFLGEAGSGRTDLVLAAAAKMQQDGRRVLVLSMMPSNKGDVRRLQLAAAAEGYDAAVINHQRQLAGIDKHAGSYDAVLIDLPAIGTEAMGEEGPIHNWLAANASFHRHLVVPMDKDPRDLNALSQAARIWSCDWIALSRTDLTTRIAKLLDLMEAFHLPISLESCDPLGRGALTIAQSSELIARVLPNDQMGEKSQARNDAPGFTKSEVVVGGKAVIW